MEVLVSKMLALFATAIKQRVNRPSGAWT